MTEPIADGLMEVLHRALEQQIAHSDPPEVATALARMIGQGLEPAAAWRELASVLLTQLNLAAAEGRDVERATYARALDAIASTNGS